MSTTETDNSVSSTDDRRIWLDLLKGIESGHFAAAMLVADPHTLAPTWLYDDDVSIEACLRRKDWAPGEEAGMDVKLPLSRLQTYLPEFDVLDIGAPSHPQRPVFLGAMSFAVDETTACGAFVVDWRGVGAMATSRRRIAADQNEGKSIGEVLTRLSERSGLEEVNRRHQIATDFLTSEYGAKSLVGSSSGNQISVQATMLAIIDHFANGAPDCEPIIHAWCIARVFPDPAILASSPEHVGTKNPAGVLADKIEAELLQSTFGATRLDYKKSRQWQLRYDDNPARDIEGNIVYHGIKSDEHVRDAEPGFRGISTPSEDVAILGSRLADNDLWPSELHSLEDDGYRWNELLAHALGLREKLGLTEREAKFLFMLEQGHNQTDIAKLTGWSESTVSRDLESAGRQIRLARQT